jgi:hypothetical protein
MLFFCNCSSTVQIQKAEIKNGPDGKGHLNGDWEIDYPSSFSEEDGGIFFESLSFKEDPSKIQDIKTQLSNFKENGEKKYIESIELLIYENALAHDPIEAGSFDVSIRAIKSEKLIDAHGIYALTQTGPLTRLSLFFMDDEAQNEFKDGLIFEFVDFCNKTFTIKNAELKSVFRYKKGQQLVKPLVEKVNMQKTLNYLCLRDKVSSVETYTYDIFPLGNRSYVTRKIISVDKLFFDSKGEITKNESENFRWNIKTTLEFHGDYYNNTAIKIIGSDTYAVSIKIIRTDSSELKSLVKQDQTFYSEKTTIQNGLRTHTTFQNENTKTTSHKTQGTIRYNYNDLGHMDSYLIFSSNHDAMDSSYYKYILLDEKKNWTQRIVFEDKYYQKPKAIEIRVIHYSDK